MQLMDVLQIDEKGTKIVAGPASKMKCYYCLAELAGPEQLGRHLMQDHKESGPAAGEGAGAQVGKELPAGDGQGLLSAEEERSLASIVQAGGPGAQAARERFVQANQGLVMVVAKRYLERGLPLADLMQEGNIGLLRAADKFDPARETRFSTYAVWWVKQAVQRALADTVRMVRVPGQVLGLGWKARRMMAQDATLRIEDVAASLGQTPKAISRALQHVAVQSVSMEAGSRDDDGGTLGDRLASPEEGAPARDFLAISKLLKSLSPKHRHIVARRFGLDGRPAASLEEVAQELGITRERVRQMQTQALAHLKRHRVGVDGSDFDVSPVAPRLTAPRRRHRYLLDDLDPNAPVVVPAPAPVGKKTPLPHQEEAIARILPELEARGRATVVMACGTGKTLVATWTSILMRGEKTLILGPSLALLQQTLMEWRAQGAAERYLCVCSDPTVRGVDDVRLSAQDLGIPVTTKPAEVRRSLAQPFDGRTVVLCTYQSARILGAGMPPGFKFDLAIFDEAHRTAGPRDRSFSFGLLDSQIGATHRLFMTATPRGVVSDGSENSPFSMDDEQVYGRQVYDLGLSEAIERGIICDYKIVIAVVTETEVANLLKGPSRIWAKGGALTARQAAYTIAFSRAVQECGVGKIITFHDGVSSAERFARSPWLNQDLLPPGFKSYHVNGKMPTGIRQIILARFNAAPASLVTNARCLTEGVDMPSVDMVAFMSPKRSRIDIIQTIGRALRKAPGKTIGYVMLPILVDEAGNPLATAQEYRDLSQVINSLRAQDKVLDRRIRSSSFDKGNGTTTSLDGLQDRLLLVGPDVMPETMMRAISVKILTPLSSSWDEMFGRLTAFKRIHGTLRISKRKGDIQLANWMVAQRQARRRHALSERQLGLLDSVNFPWNPKKDAWGTMIEALGSWKAEHGHCNVPSHFGKLGGFVGNCRRMKRIGKLLPERIAELDTMGFLWREDEYKSDGDRWKEKYEQLRAFKAAHGHLDLPGADFDLRRWATHQRERKSFGKLSRARQALLDGIGFCWRLSVRRLQQPRRTDRVRKPIGTIVIRREFSNGRDVPERWIKVSDTDVPEKRWKLYARWWWEQNRGPVPKGMAVLHKNGDPLDDSPGNLLVGGPGDRIRLAHINDPEMSKRNQRTVHEGCAAWNRRQGKLYRFKNLVKSTWYPVIERSRVVLNIPFRKRLGLLRAFGADCSKVPLCGHGPEVDKAVAQAGVIPVKSSDIMKEPYSAYARVDLEMGIANPEAAGGDAEARVKALEGSRLWSYAQAANAKDTKKR